MPELPEVETTRRGLSDRLPGETVRAVEVRNPKLRWPVGTEMALELPGQRIRSVERRAKYLIIRAERGSVILHLGMSGSLQVQPPSEPMHPHDHVVWHFGERLSVRLRDPRRFGAAVWVTGEPLDHPLLCGLGPEPLEADFSGASLYERARGRRSPVKGFLMDGRVVAGVGNIYATESLYRAGIHPGRAAGRIAPARYDLLAEELQGVLREAIERGGTTLRDFVGSDGARGYFVDRLDAYGRAGQPCRGCGRALRHLVIGQRSTVYCTGCQR